MRIVMNLDSVSLDVRNDDGEVIAQYSGDNISYTLDTNRLAADIGKLAEIVSEVAVQLSAKREVI